MRKKDQGEVILRVTYQIDATKDKPRPEPVVLVLADRKGWRSLAEEFLRMSEAKLTKRLIAVDPEGHQHINSTFHRAINRRLSHPLEFRLGLLTNKTRTKILKKYGMEKPLPEDADMRSLFHRLTVHANNQIRRTKW